MSPPLPGCRQAGALFLPSRAKPSSEVNRPPVVRVALTCRALVPRACVRLSGLQGTQSVVRSLGETAKQRGPQQQVPRWFAERTVPPRARARCALCGRLPETGLAKAWIPQPPSEGTPGGAPDHSWTFSLSFSSERSAMESMPARSKFISAMMVSRTSPVT